MTVSEKALSSTFPRGQVAWSGMNSGVQRQLSDGLSTKIERERINGENIRNDFFPKTTELFNEWENTFRLPTGEYLTDQQRRERLDASWSKESSASFSGMNNIFAKNGLNVIARPISSGEDPRTITDVDMIFANGRPGESIKNYLAKCGAMRTGLLSQSSRCGAFSGSIILPPVVVVPDDPWTWPLLFVIEGDSGAIGEIPYQLKDAFEFLVYKIKPLFMWAISRVIYV